MISFPRFLALVCLVSLFLPCEAAPEVKPFQRELERLATGLLAAHPELREGRRAREVHAATVREWRRDLPKGASGALYKKLKRRKADYKDAEWRSLVKRATRARLEQTSHVFLLEKARAQKLSNTGKYIVEHLLREGYTREVEAREELSKRRLREVGKRYSAFLKSHGRAPLTLCELELGESLWAVQSTTGVRAPWVYVGDGAKMMKGSNNYRVVAYAPFVVGRKKGARLVGYKGGRVSEWKEKTVLKKHAAMFRENEKERVRLLAKKKAKKQKLVKVEKKPVPVEPEVKALAQKQGEPLLITIKELW